MPYKERLDGDFAPELFLTGAVFGEIPGLDYVFSTPRGVYNRFNYRQFLHEFVDFYQKLDPIIITQLKESKLKETLAEKLATLRRWEEPVIRFRYGFEDGTLYTLKETAQRLPISSPVTSPGIKGIQDKALRKLRHPNRSRDIRRELESSLGIFSPELLVGNPYFPHYGPKES